MRQSKPIGERRIRLERSDPKRVRHASFIATNPLQSGKPQGRREKHRTSDRFVVLNRHGVRGPAGAMKRRSGIVRRPAAPDSASAASERCRGHETSREASDQGCRGVYVRHVNGAGVTEPRQVGPVVRDIAGRARSSLRAAIDSTQQGGREHMTPKRTRDDRNDAAVSRTRKWVSVRRRQLESRAKAGQSQ